MTGLIFLVVFGLLQLLCLFFGVKEERKQLSRVFTQNYKELRKIYPTPLYTWRFLSGDLCTKRWYNNLTFKASLKLDVYNDMLIVSEYGKGLCLRYDQCVLKHTQAFLFHDLVFKNLPVQEQSTSSAFIGRIDLGHRVDLRVCLSEKKLNIILKQAQKGGGCSSSIP